MERIGGHSPAEFCPLPAEPSPVRYRSRCRLHVSGAGCETVLGYFAARSHRVEPLTDCEAISKETVDLLPRIRDAIAASGARVREVALLESADSRQHIGRFVLDGDWASSRRVSACLSSILDGVCVEQEEPALRLEEGERRIVADVGGRLFPLSVDTFFQANRYLVPRLFDDVRRAAREVPSGRGLDAYGGTGLFAAALLDAGHEVTTVEASPGAVRDARAAHSLWPDGERWNIVASTVSSFAARERTGFDLAVVDPPRAGLGRELAALLAGHVRHRIIYISCEPATLARDLPAILARNYRISSARLYDLFAGTHRVEAMVTLERKDRA